MRKLLPCAALILFSIAGAAAQTAPAEPSETLNGVNVQKPPAAPIPPTPSLAPIHEGVVAGTVDSLPAAQNEKMRELKLIEEQNRVAAASPDPIPHAATVTPAQGGKPHPLKSVRAAAKAPARKMGQPSYRGM